MADMIIDLLFKGFDKIEMAFSPLLWLQSKLLVILERGTDIPTSTLRTYMGLKEKLA